MTAYGHVKQRAAERARKALIPTAEEVVCIYALQMKRTASLSKFEH